MPHTSNHEQLNALRQDIAVLRKSDVKKEVKLRLVRVLLEKVEQLQAPVQDGLEKFKGNSGIIPEQFAC